MNKKNIFSRLEVMKNQIQTVSEVKNSSSTSTLAHETRKKIVKIVSILSAVAVIAIFAGVLTGCQREQENEPLDEAILNSSELEEYIVAGADLERSMSIFASELNKIDFSTLKVTYEPGWIKVVHLPISSNGSISIDEKVRIFNEKKETFRKKFPHFVSFKEDVGIKYFQQCIQNSVKVQGEFLKLGISTSKPLLKNGSEFTMTYYGSNETAYLQGFFV